EPHDPAPLMGAAAQGRLEVVEALVAVGADVNAQAEALSGDLDQFPFLDGFFADARLTALTPLAYAALYGQHQVYDYLAPKTHARWRREAEALRPARGGVPDPGVRAYLPPQKSTSARQAAGA